MEIQNCLFCFRLFFPFLLILLLLLWLHALAAAVYICWLDLLEEHVYILYMYHQVTSVCDILLTVPTCH